ncbi:MAG: aldehyde dehydrogenase, partial [Planctomycetes bacterium]|nr:aldehyde dehydrogenase [Planctomycetota bacterium]
MRAWLLAACFGLAANAAQFERADRQFLDGLLARRLFSMAELECRQKLQDGTLSDTARVEWVIELMRTRSERAAHAATANRAAHWQAAHDAAREFLERYPEARRRVLVEVQDALTSLAEGELARMEADVAAQPEAARERALTTIREAARELERLDKTLIEQITRGGGRDADDGALTTDELFSLQNNVRFQLARAYRNRALCYLPKSDDRVAALSMAVEQLHRTLSQLRADDPLAR